MVKNLVKLWKLKQPLKGGFKRDLDNNIYYEGVDGLYKLDPYTGEVELTNLPIITKIEGKIGVKVSRGGSSYSLNLEDDMSYKTFKDYTDIKCNKNVICFESFEPKNRHLRVYDIENGEKVYDMMYNSGLISMAVDSKYLIIGIHGVKKRFGKIVIFDTEKKEIYKIENTLGFRMLDTENPLCYTTTNRFLDVVGYAYTKYGNIRLFIGIRDSLYEYEYSTPIYVSEDSYVFEEQWWKTFDENYRRILSNTIDEYYRPYYPPTRHQSLWSVLSNQRILTILYDFELEGQWAYDEELNKNVFAYRTVVGGDVDFTILNLNGEITHRWVLSAKEFVKIFELDYFGKYSIFPDFFDIQGNTIIFLTRSRIFSFKLNRYSLQREWIKNISEYSYQDPVTSYLYQDLVKPYCLVFNEENYRGSIIGLQDGSEVFSGVFSSRPRIFYNGIILFENGAAYGVKGIFENAYVEALEKLVKNK